MKLSLKAGTGLKHLLVLILILLYYLIFLGKKNHEDVPIHLLKKLPRQTEQIFNKKTDSQKVEYKDKMDLLPSNAILKHLEERERGVHFFFFNPQSPNL